MLNSRQQLKLLNLSICGTNISETLKFPLQELPIVENPIQEIWARVQFRGAIGMHCNNHYYILLF